MTYRMLGVSAAPPHCQTLVRRLEDHYLRDVHAMFRLPIPNYRITAGLNFAIAQSLLAVVSGLSVTLYHAKRGSGARFKGILEDHYPWSAEPPSALKGAAAAEAIYEVFRNPLTHDLGLDLEKKAKTQIVKIKRYVRKNGQRGLTERQVESREQTARRPPNMSGAVTRHPGSTVLLVDALYWGIRVMIEDMAADTKVTTTAEPFLLFL